MTYLSLYGLGDTEDAYHVALEDYIANPTQQTYAAALTAYQADLVTWQSEKNDALLTGARGAANYAERLRRYEVALQKYEAAHARWVSDQRGYQQALSEWTALTSARSAWMIKQGTWTGLMNQYMDCQDEWDAYWETYNDVQLRRKSITAVYDASAAMIQRDWGWAGKLPTARCISAALKAHQAALCSQTTRSVEHVRGLDGEVQEPGTNTYYGTDSNGVPYCASAALPVCQAWPQLPPEPRPCAQHPGPPPTEPPPAGSKPTPPSAPEPQPPVRPPPAGSEAATRPAPQPPAPLEQQQAASAAGGFSGAGLLLAALAAGGAYVLYKRSKRPKGSK